MRYYLHIPVPVDLSGRVGAFEQRWQGSAKSEPHITVVIPRLLSAGSSEAELAARLESALAAVPAFPIRMTGVDYFGSKSVIHIAVERSPEFTYCHETAIHAVEDLLEPSTGEHASISHPHITLAARLSPEKGERALREALTQDWYGEFPCDHVHLLRIAPRDARWRIAAVLPLCSRENICVADIDANQKEEEAIRDDTRTRFQ